MYTTHRLRNCCAATLALSLITLASLAGTSQAQHTTPPQEALRAATSSIAGHGVYLRAATAANAPALSGNGPAWNGLVITIDETGNGSSGGGEEGGYEFGGNPSSGGTTYEADEERKGEAAGQPGGSGRAVEAAPIAVLDDRAAPRPDDLANYPNPFNPETTIRFDVGHAQRVRLTVFNVLGQAVAVLVEGQVEAGPHEARFAGHALPSGTYFARLETEAGVVTRTMVLAK